MHVNRGGFFCTLGQRFCPNFKADRLCKSEHIQIWQRQGILRGNRSHFRLTCVAQNVYALYQWGACSPWTTLKTSKIKETTNFSRQTTLIRPQISKPHGAGMGGMKILLHVNLAFVILAQKCMPKSHPI